MNHYIDEFLSLRCAGDVLNVVNPLGNKSQKEITESMAVIKRIKHIVLKDEPMTYSVVDLCAGNALTSVLAAFLFPIKQAIAVDKKPRNRKWNTADRFDYRLRDILNDPITGIDKNTIIISIHPCGKLAEKVCEIYNKSEASHLILMPCCKGQFKSNQWLKERLGNYGEWCLHLSNLVDGQLVQDMNVISPKNIVITAKKG